MSLNFITLVTSRVGLQEDEPQKTKFVLFRTPFRTVQIPNARLTIFGEEIEQVLEMNYLGIISDRLLTV